MGRLKLMGAQGQTKDIDIDQAEKYYLVAANESSLYVVIQQHTIVIMADMINDYGSVFASIGSMIHNEDNNDLNFFAFQTAKARLKFITRVAKEIYNETVRIETN